MTAHNSACPKLAGHMRREHCHAALRIAPHVWRCMAAQAHTLVVGGFDAGMTDEMSDAIVLFFRLTLPAIVLATVADSITGAMNSIVQPSAASFPFFPDVLQPWQARLGESAGLSCRTEYADIMCSPCWNWLPPNDNVRQEGPRDSRSLSCGKAGCTGHPFYQH